MYKPAMPWRMRYGEIFAKEKAKPKTTAKGKPMAHKSNDTSQPLKTTGMELMMTWGFRKVRRKVLEFHAWTHSCSSSQVVILVAKDASWTLIFTFDSSSMATSKLLPEGSVAVAGMVTSSVVLGRAVLYISKRMRLPASTGSEKSTLTLASAALMEGVSLTRSLSVPSRTVNLTEDSSVKEEPSGSWTVRLATCSPSSTTASQVMRVGTPPRTLPVDVSFDFAVATSLVSASAESGAIRAATNDRASAVTAIGLKYCFRIVPITTPVYVESRWLIRKWVGYSA